MNWTSAQCIEWALDCAAGDSGPSNDTASAAIEAGVAEWDDDGTDRGSCVAVWTSAFEAQAASISDLLEVA